MLVFGGSRFPTRFISCSTPTSEGPFSDFLPSPAEPPDEVSFPLLDLTQFVRCEGEMIQSAQLLE